MDKDVIYVYTQTHTQWEITHLIRKGNLVICNNMDGSRVYYAQWNKSDRKTLHDLICMWNLNQTKQKEKQTNRYRGETEWREMTG